MTTDELDMVDEIYGAAPAAAPASPPNAPAGAAAVAQAPTRSRPQVAHPAARNRAGRRRIALAAKLGIAFLVGAIVSFVIVTVVALAALSAFSNRIVPGVRVGSVDLSGMDRAQAIARLQDAYAYLGQGDATVTTPRGVATITYQQAGRGPDTEYMADTALRFGHSGNPIDDAAYMLQTALNGQSVPIAVRLDPTAVATCVRQLVDTNLVQPHDALVTPQSGDFALGPSTAGSRIDETAVSSAIVARLAQPDAPASVQIGSPFVALNPQISDKDAQNAAAEAQRMIVAIKLTWGGPSQDASKAPVPAKTFTLEPRTIWGWIGFGTRSDGSYGPSVTASLVESYVAQFADQVTVVQPIEPSVVYDAAGKPSSLTGGKDGTGIDAAATAKAIEAYLASLASGGSPVSSLPIASGPISPRLTLASLKDNVIIGNGKGAWTTTFFPGVSNGFGANIRTPAAILNGQVVAPGAQFSFLKAMGPIDRAHGFTMGGVIEDGKSNHTGAMGGGICSASTTMFNAAARAGLQIDERHAHFYYIDRYPVGLDATVYSNGFQVWDLKWTNDTANPILIRAWATKGARSKITIQLLSLPLDRKVTFSPEFKANVVRAGDHKQYVTTLKPGQQNRTEYPTAGFSTSRTRTVTDSTGKVIHTDTWFSRYVKVDGILQIGKAKTPAPTQTPAPPAAAAPAPAVPAPAPAAVATATDPGATTGTQRRYAR